MKKKDLKPKISILMVVNNEEKKIIKSIRSVLNQNFNKFEMLIFDNNSTDKTKFFLRNLTKDEKKIKVFYSKKNLGITKALNFLIKKTKTKVIARIDGDDYWNINKLRIQYPFFKVSNKNIVGTNSYYLKNDKIYSSSNLPIYNIEIRNKLIYSNPFIHSSIIFNKKFFKSYNPEYLKCQDYDAWLRLSLNKNLKFKNIKRKLTYIDLSKPLSFLSAINDIKIRYKHLKHLKLLKSIFSFTYIFISIFKLFYKVIINKK